jgi:group I intron endonuclease
LIIYKTTNLINGKIYIGQDSFNNPEYYGSGLKLKRSILKYGKENFVKEIIDTADSKSELNEKEKFWIKKLNSQDPKIGYNITEGGTGGDTLSNHPNIIEIGEKIRIRISGEKNGFHNKKHSEESKQKMKDHSYWKGRDGINLGKTKSQETVEKHRQKLIGKKLSKDACKNIADGHKIKVCMYDLDWNFIKIYDSINEAADENNLHNSNISRACKSKSGKCGKFKWRYESKSN